MTTLRATARLQLHKDFTFEDAERVLPYYASLGISHIYASPILTARKGSTHGYDIVDPTRINPELGGEIGFRRFVEAVRKAGMGLIQDIVPNHMGIGPENPWWQHVLEWGQKSPYAGWFDIDWKPADDMLHGKVMAPFLGKPYGDALTAGEIKLEFDQSRGKFFISYFSHRFPLSPDDYASVLLTTGSERLAPAVAMFESFQGEFSDLTQQNADVGFGLLRELAETAEGMSDIDAVLAAYSAGTPQGFAALHELLERQHYRLAWWRCAADGINWRRFFEVTDLAGVRVEQEDVFEATHALIFRLYAEGLIDGVRIDHVDGLADPGAYCRKLRSRLQALSSQRPAELPPAPAYIIVEKILAPEEQLRDGWAIDGTSGYEFMDQVGALMHDEAGEATLTALWEDLTGHEGDFLSEVRQARRQLLANNLAGEFEAAARALHALARTDLRTRDFSLGAIRRVFIELLVCFPVYRTYINGDGHDAADQEIMERTLVEARQSVDRTEVPLLEVIARWLGGEMPGITPNARVRHLHQRAVTRFQQLTPPLAAKSVEDTAFYRYGRLLSRNEVGADPGQFCRSIESFHEACRVRAARFPNNLLATATHDHKRGEDVRMRIAALSEVAEEWSAAVRKWVVMNAPLRSEIPPEDGSSAVSLAPQTADELMLYQMLVGAWPVGLAPDDETGIKAFADRIDQWQTKALREAKQVSGWVMPNENYEAACRLFLYGVLQVGRDNRFLPELITWVQRLASAGAAKSLSQTVLRLTVPGVPDLYQGADLWDLTLVDPDNRRPVDYRIREQMLKDAAVPVSGTHGWETGYIKQQVIHHCLGLRSEMPQLFAQGAYLALQVEGPMSGSVVAFARTYRDQIVIVVACLYPFSVNVPGGSLAGTQDSTPENMIVLPFPDKNETAWVNRLTDQEIESHGRHLKLDELLQTLPVAVLSRRSE
ncbi:MAG: treY [Paucimonas sp.]|jgi:(1->4)-alpha-D-glucan 1-alpha-D-glucosylmutase|nr:treY [Paucimonas sp.]